MKKYLVLIPILVLALFQGAFLSLNLVLLAVVVWSAIRPPKETPPFAFASGLFLDLACSRRLGISSLLFLLFCFLLLLYRRKFDPLHPLFWTVFVFLVASLYSLATDQLLNWPGAAILTIFAFLARLSLKYLSPEFKEEEIKLRV